MKKKRKINLCYHSYGPELNLDWGTKIQQGEKKVQNKVQETRYRKKKKIYVGTKKFFYLFLFIFYLNQSLMFLFK